MRRPAHDMRCADECDLSTADRAAIDARPAGTTPVCQVCDEPMRCTACARLIGFRDPLRDRSCKVCAWYRKWRGMTEAQIGDAMDAEFAASHPAWTDADVTAALFGGVRDASGERGAA